VQAIPLRRQKSASGAPRPETAGTTDLRSRRNFSEFSEAVKSADFIETFDKSFHRQQFPYVLVALSLGERYRYVAKFAFYGQDPARFSIFYQIAICFLVAHEIAHLINGDLVRLYKYRFERRFQPGAAPFQLGPQP
jgi:hypothetical protein